VQVFSGLRVVLHQHKQACQSTFESQHANRQVQTKRLKL